MDIKKFQGKTLQEIEDSSRGLTKERLFALDKNGNVIAAYQGNETSVAFKGSLLFEKGATVTHNHPNGSEGYGGTFSFADVQNMAVSSWAEHRASASGKNEYNYIIRRTSKTTTEDSKKLYNRIAKDQPMLEKQISEAASKAKGVSAASKRQIYTGILDNYYAKVLPEYNFEYIARNKTYKYNR